MIRPLPETLDLLDPHLATELVPPVALARVRTLAQKLPAATSSAMLECHLGQSAPRVDCSISAIADHGGRERLGAEPLPECDAWRRIRDFCDAWAAPSSPLGERVPLVWLEFDLDDEPSTASVPSFFVRLQQLQPRPRALNWCQERQRDLQTAIAALEPLCGRNAALELGQHLDAAYTRGRLAHIGVMFPRPTSAIRACIEFEADALHDALFRNGAGTFVPCLRRVHAALDIGANAAVDALALECFFDDPADIAEALPPFLDELVRR